jgi:hypothetical protein
LDVEIEPTLSATNDIEGLGGERCIFSGTGCKVDIEMFLGSELSGSDNLLFCNVNTDDVSTSLRKGTR